MLLKELLEPCIEKLRVYFGNTTHQSYATTLQGIPRVLVLKDISHIIYGSWDNHWSMIIKLFLVVENLTVWRMIILKEVTLKKGIIFFLKKWTNTWRMNFTIQEDGRRKLYKIFHMWELWWYNVQFIKRSVSSPKENA